MLLYKAYGLVVSSNQAIPGLVGATVSDQIDFVIHFIGRPALPFALTPHTGWYAGRELEPEPKSNVLTRWLHSADDQQFFQVRFSDAGEYSEFTLDVQASRAWVRWSDGTPFQDVANLFLRPVLGMVLLTHAKTLLHGSLVRVNEHAIAIVGPPGAGKSTLAAALAQRGQFILADDIVTLVDLDTRFLVHPAIPSLAVTSTAAASLFDSSETLPSLWSSGGKRVVGLQSEFDSTLSRFEQEPLPLGAVYYLAPRSTAFVNPSIQPVSPISAVLTLIANRYNTGTLSKSQQEREFEILTRLAAIVPVRRLDRPDDLAKMPLVCDAFLQDATALLPSHNHFADQTTASLQLSNV